MTVVGAIGGEEALDQAQDLKPQVSLVGLDRPGLETIRRLRARDPQARILVFSMHDSRVMIERALAAGAAGYLNKSSVAGQMVDAVHSVAKGELLHQHISVRGAALTDAVEADLLQGLTKREFQVFCKLAEGQTVIDIAEVLSISPKTVGVHQTNIMHKLELRNPAELTRLAIRSGAIEP